jgi:hypothetical protein
MKGVWWYRDRRYIFSGDEILRDKHDGGRYLYNGITGSEVRLRPTLEALILQ